MVTTEDRDDPPAAQRNYNRSGLGRPLSRWRRVTCLRLAATRHRRPHQAGCTRRPRIDPAERQPPPTDRARRGPGRAGLSGGRRPAVEPLNRRSQRGCGGPGPFAAARRTPKCAQIRRGRGRGRLSATLCGTASCDRKDFRPMSNLVRAARRTGEPTVRPGTKETQMRCNGAGQGHRRQREGRARRARGKSSRRDVGRYNEELLKAGTGAGFYEGLTPSVAGKRLTAASM